ncbi:MAG: hypothetical protein QNL88_05525 [Acidobacteriota bacterium]|nr:hypothetical protein [Acidobacteriota bacterium]
MVGTKLDSVADRERALADLAAVGTRHGVRTTAISAVTGEGVDQLVRMLLDLVEEARKTP